MDLLLLGLMTMAVCDRFSSKAEKKSKRQRKEELRRRENKRRKYYDDINYYEYLHGKDHP